MTIKDIRKDLNLKKIKDLKLNDQLDSLKQCDTSMAAAFVAAIAVLLLVAGYVIHRLAKDHAYREKWKDYSDCGWA
ncbi:MAG: hypothetical protein FWG94_11815 [Oscillospiraceae bacterium]|nr:hypothetical protein [Oscillospiraceae bacterium]